MPLPDIQLDDRTFEKIVADARRRIPGYTPEWTDLNESDPGVTLVELFAWLGEMILWRLNRVPDKNYLKFLELIGIELNPPKPASVELSFKLTLKDKDPEGGFVWIPQGTKVSPSEQADGGGPVIFETDDNLYAVAAQLSALQSYDGAQFQLVTELNQSEGKVFYPLSLHPQKGAAFYLGFTRAFPPSPAPHVLTFHAYTADLIEEGKGIAADLPPPPPPVIAIWEYWENISAKWQRLPVVRDTTASLTRTGALYFNAPPTMDATQLGLLRKPADKPLFWFRLRIEQILGAGYQIAPRLEAVLINTVSATNAVSVTSENLGASEGTPNQIFRVAHAPVLLESFVLEVDEEHGFEPWRRVSDFAGSSRTSQDYIVNPATGEIAFGDGEHGKIPARFSDANDPTRTVANIQASYRWGGGARGNIGANKITSLQSPVPYIESVTNARPSIGGEDEETVEDAKRRAPNAIRTQSRAITAGDFVFLAQQTPGARIRRARALPLHHPDFEPIRPAGSQLPATTVPVPGVVTVIVVPDSLGTKPMPSEDVLKLVGQWLNQHRLITTEIYVAAPRYREVQIEARVFVAPSANGGQVEKALNDMLLEYFHPLKGGSDGSGWDFGGTIYFSEIYRRILDTNGVTRVLTDSLNIYVNGKRVPPCQDVALDEDELVFSTEHKIVATYA
jgi:predicted phage baseplate assembly protein